MGVEQEAETTGTRHRLLVILAADAVGYSRLMATDDRATVASLDEARGVFRAHIASHAGRIVDTAGDSVLAAFDTAAGAVLAALAIQRQLLAQAEPLPEARRMHFRIGLHLGDVIEKADGTLYGDGVNIAARLQALGAPGDVTVSNAVHDAVFDRVEAAFDDLGAQPIKNIARPVRVYRVRAVAREAAAHDGPAEPVGNVGSTADAQAQRIEEPKSLTGPTNLAATLDALIGRDADVAALSQSLATHRLITILGSGGIGKTRLAQAVARERVGLHRHGVWWIDLAALSAPDKIVAAIAQGAHVELDDTNSAAPLARALARRDLLLVLDNCEHLIADLAPIVRSLLHAAPQLAVLATSQEPLKIAGEQLYRLGALSVPPADATLEAACAHSAVQLLEQRAQAADARFRLSDATIAAAIDLCRHLDGVALAIEMAAARLPLLGVAQVLARLGERFRLLRSAERGAAARHQTLHATLDWSHSLLSDNERTVLRRLSVFVGSFRLEAAQQVAASDDIDEWAVLDDLAALADKSLLQVEPGDPPRYRMLETMRLYAAERLVQHAEQQATWVRHGRAMAWIADEAERGFWISADRPWWARHAADMDDLELAFERACGRGDVDIVAVVGEALQLRQEWRRVLSARDRHVEAAHALLPLAIGRARALIWNWLAASWPVPVAGVPRLTAAWEAVAAWRELAEAPRLYLALGALAVKCAQAGELEACRKALAEAQRIEDPQWPPLLRYGFMKQASYTNSLLGAVEPYRNGVRRELALAEAAGAEYGASFARFRLVDVALMAGDFDEAVLLGRSVVAEQRTNFQDSRLAGALHNLCGALLMRGDLAEAGHAARESWPLMVDHGGFGYLLSHLALLAARVGRFESGALMLGRMDAWSEATQNALEFNEVRSARLAADTIELALGADETEHLRVTGRLLNAEQIDALVRAVLDESLSAVVDGQGRERIFDFSPDTCHELPTTK